MSGAGRAGSGARRLVDGDGAARAGGPAGSTAPAVEAEHRVDEKAIDRAAERAVEGHAAAELE